MDNINAIEMLSYYSDEDYIKEFLKIKELIHSWGTYRIANCNESLEYLFNQNIFNWKYRNTFTDLNEIYDKLKLNNIPNKKNVKNKLLTLLELYFNIDSFVTDVIFENNQKYYNECAMVSDYDLYNNIIEIEDGMVYENCDLLIKSLGYTIYYDNGIIRLISKESDVISTIDTIDDKSISNLLVEYVDYRNKNNLKEKKRILCDIACYLEPRKSKIPQDDLKNTIFKLFNRINIRHNNTECKERIELLEKANDEVLLDYYDRTFSLCLTAIRLIEFKKDKSIYDLVK